MPDAPDPTTLEPAILRSLDRLLGRAPGYPNAPAGHLLPDVDAAYLAAGISPSLAPRLDVAQALARGIDAQRRLAVVVEALTAMRTEADKTRRSSATAPADRQFADGQASALDVAMTLIANPETAAEWLKRHRAEHPE